MLLNGVRYNFHSWDFKTGVLQAFHYVATNPLVTGTDYEVRIPEGNVIVSTDTERDVQFASSVNQNTGIKLADARLSRLREVEVNLSTIVGDTNTAEADLDFLNQESHRGALVSEDVRDAVGVVANNPVTTHTRDEDKDIQLPAGSWEGATVAGSTAYIVSDTNPCLLYTS